MWLHHLVADSGGGRPEGGGSRRRQPPQNRNPWITWDKGVRLTWATRVYLETRPSAAPFSAAWFFRQQQSGDGASGGDKVVAGTWTYATPHSLSLARFLFLCFSVSSNSPQRTTGAALAFPPATSPRQPHLSVFHVSARRPPQVGEALVSVVSLLRRLQVCWGENIVTDDAFWSLLCWCNM